MHIECLQTDEAFQALSKEWNKLLNNSDSNNIFLTWEWISSWWEFFKEDVRLYLITVRDEKGQLIGIAPLKIDKLSSQGFPYRQLSFIGSGKGVTADYLNFLIASGKEKEVIKEIFIYLWKNKRQWDIINLTNIFMESPVSEIILKVASENGWRCRIEPGLPCPYITLPDSWDTYLKTLSGKMRYEMRRRLRLLETQHKVKFVRLKERREIESGLDTFLNLHENRWAKKGSRGILGFHKEISEFHKRLALKFYEKDWLNIFFLEIDGVPVASLYGYEYGNKIFHYNSGFDDRWSKYGVAKQLIAFVVEDCIKRGLREFDFLRGAEPYKYEWTTQERRLLRVLLWNDTMRSRAHKATYTGYLRLKEDMKGKFPSTFSFLKSMKGVLKRQTR